jgi:dihydrofolate reductase/thymidylate synthase
MEPLTFQIILAMDPNGLIGCRYKKENLSGIPEYIIPWKVPDDMKLFKKITSSVTGLKKKNALIMGRNTSLTVPNFVDRISLVLSSSQCNEKNGIKNWNDLLVRCNEIYQNGEIEKFFIIGGAQVYKQSLLYPHEYIYLSIINKPIHIPEDYEPIYFCKTFEQLIHDYEIVQSEEYIDFTFYKLRPKFQFFEHIYKTIINKIMLYGINKESRNAITKSINDVSFKIHLKHGFPILTIKRTFWRGIVEELLWMLRGHTDTNKLKEKNIHIWDGNSSREYLDKYGFNSYKEGDIGPGYGFQMRHAGAVYFGCDYNYRNIGIDQVNECINLIKQNPNSRRIIINLWNVKDIDKMALPPCHYNYQFTVTNGELNCHLYQRSWDILLGWNTSTAALLTHIFAEQTGLKVGTLTHTICDIHLYHNHLNSIDELMNRQSYQLPTLKILNHKDNIDDYIFEDFLLENYQSHPPIKLQMFA